MADVLMIAGKPETIFKARDFEYLVEKHMGYEAAKYFREYAEKADEEVRSAKAGENTDLASYEADLESNHRAFQDIQTEAAVITGVLQEKRINREKIAHAVREIGKIISTKYKEEPKMKNDALNHFKEEMNKRGLFRKIQVCANLIPPARC